MKDKCLCILKFLHNIHFSRYRIEYYILSQHEFRINRCLVASQTVLQLIEDSKLNYHSNLSAVLVSTYIKSKHTLIWQLKPTHSEQNPNATVTILRCTPSVPKPQNHADDLKLTRVYQNRNFPIRSHYYTIAS